MNPDLVCKIVVRTTSGKRYRGSGYPITPDRIITAAHVVADAANKGDAALKGAARDITLAFGVEEQTLATPVYLEWCGTDAGVDVAVLRCQLPAALQPAHLLCEGIDSAARMRPGAYHLSAVGRWLWQCRL